MEEIRKKIRGATIGRKAEFKRKSVKVNGVEVDVEQPSVASRAQIMKRSRDSNKVAKTAKGKDREEIGAQDVLSSLDYGKMQAWATIYCAKVPDSDDMVYSEEDFDALLNRPAGGFVDKLSQAAMELMNVDAEEDAKN